MKSFLLSLVFVSALLLPSRSLAQVPFGGLEVFTFPCTCSPFRYVVLTPVWISPNPVPVTGAFADTYAHTFAWYVGHPGAWDLGFFTPGVQACWMYVGVGCAPLPVLGTITPFTGTSL